METRTVGATKALELQALLNVAKAGTLQFRPAHHKIEASGNAMLVDPVNGEPFVFVAPNVVHVFPSKPGSGTDHLRQRIEADLWFQKCAAKQQLIDALVSDKLGQFSRPEEIKEVLRNGFQGFCNMTSDELIQAANDADLIGRDPDVAALVSALEAENEPAVEKPRG